MKKIVSVLLTLAMMISMMSIAFANNVEIGDPTPPPGMGNAVSKVLGILQWVGYAFSVGMLIYIGIKYVMSAANEKADLKQGLINFVIGAILISGAATICGWLSEITLE